MERGSNIKIKTLLTAVGFFVLFTNIGAQINNYKKEDGKARMNRTNNHGLSSFSRGLTPDWGFSSFDFGKMGFNNSFNFSWSWNKEKRGYSPAPVAGKSSFNKNSLHHPFKGREMIFGEMPYNISSQRKYQNNGWGLNSTTPGNNGWGIPTGNIWGTGGWKK